MSEPTQTEALAYRHELTVEELATQVNKIHTVMAKVMKSGEHYGVIPGTRKPTLYKPGAELLCMLFRLDPQYSVEEIRDGDHLTVRSTVTLWHIPTGLRMGSGMGACSTRESKYAYRRAGRKCPHCGKEDTLIRGKAEFGGGWLCYGKRGGCGQKFRDGDAAIEGQQTEERIANPDLPDAHNTVLKMSNKRGLVAAVLNVTAASEIFTQDLDKRDEADEADDGPPARTEAAAPAVRANETARPAAPDPDAIISEPQVRRFSAIAAAAKWTDEQLHDLLAGYEYNSRKDIRQRHYDALVDTLKLGPERGMMRQAGAGSQGRLA